MHVLKALLWMLSGIGLTLFLMNDDYSVQRVGLVLVMIALLWRLLLYLRDTQPSWERINALGTPKLSVIEAAVFEQPAAAPATLRTADVLDRSPVQKLIDEEKPN